MSSSSPLLGPLSDLVARCVLAFERDGDAAVDRELAAHPELADEARRQIGALRRIGLLQEPVDPETLGPYRVVRRLGIGGMGTVWLCEQTHPIRREVAVKVMRAGFDLDEMLARFHVERQALGLLNDPCIARVLDSGLTADRRPYLVMDYVPGTTITQFSDQRGLTIAQRLRLFAQVCDAVQHAHTKGIVHRDLKPSNVLVVERDGEPLPVVIDFGVAKFVSHAMQSASLLTIPGRLIGTPEYMSPEQARSDVDIDTRTDVYSLGVLLYELLTSCLPIESAQLRNLADLARVLVEVDPPRPSVRLAGLGQEQLAQRAEQRGTSSLGLLRGLRGELEWICSRAMAKQRERRYVTAADLAQDVRRYLAQEPVTAGPPSRWYALRKFCSRYRLPVAALLTLGLALGVMTTASVWFWREAVASERSANVSNARLEHNLDSAIVALDRMVALGADGLRTPASEPMRRALFRTALDLHQRLGDGSGTAEPRLAASLAAALGRSAQLHELLGESDESLAQLEHAEQVLRSFAPANGASAVALMQVGRAHLFCGSLRDQRAELVLAREHYVAARTTFAMAAEAGGDLRAVRTGTLTALRNLANVENGTDVAAARSLLATARPLAEAQLADSEATPEQQAEGLLAIVSLAWFDGETDQGTEAVELLTRMLGVVERCFAAAPDLAEQLRLVPGLQQLASTAVRLRETGIAKQSIGRLLSTLRAAVAAEPAVASHRVDLAQGMLMQALLDNGTVAPEILRQNQLDALQLERDGGALQPHSPELSAQRLAHLLDFAWGQLDWLRGDDAHRAVVDLDQLSAFVDEATNIWRALPAACQQDRHSREAWLESFTVRAGLAEQRRDLVGGQAALTEGLQFAGQLLTDHPEVVQVRMIRAEMHLDLARLAQQKQDDDAAWHAARLALDDLGAACPQFSRPTRWMRFASQCEPTVALLHQLASTRREAADLAQVGTTIAGIASLARRLDRHSVDCMRAAATGIFAAAVRLGLPREALAAQACDPLRDLPEFEALLR